MLSLTDVAPVATTGTLSIQKVVDDPAYYGPAGALFDIEGPDGVSRP